MGGTTLFLGGSFEPPNFPKKKLYIKNSDTYNSQTLTFYS